ncbi:MAG: translocation/assembly module TamB [Treponema sp.]|nr:translocation/assembly module TamB [Treponema sp.]
MSSERVEQDRDNIIAFSPRVGEARKSHGPGGGKFRFAFHFLIFAALVAAGFCVVRPVSTTLARRMDTLRDQILDQGEALIGRRIEYGSLEPSFLGGIDIRSLKISGKGQEPLVSVARLHIAWSLWDLLSGNVEFLRIRSLRLDSPRVYVDYELDRDLLDLPARLNGSGGQAKLPNPLSVHIRDGVFVLAGLGNLNGLDLDAEIRGDRFETQGGLNLNIGFSGLNGLDGLDGGPLNELLGFLSSAGIPAPRLSTTARFRLACDTGFNEGRAFLSVPFLVEDHFRTGALSVDMELRDRVLSLSSVSPEEVSRSPLTVNLSYGLDTEELSVRLRCRDYSPGDTLEVLDSWEAYRPFLAVRTSGEALFSSSARGLEYRADLSGLVPAGLPLDGSGFTVKVEGNKQYARFDRLELTLTRGPRKDNPGGVVAFRGGLDLAALSPHGVLNVQDFSLTGEGGLSTVLTVEGAGKDIAVAGESLHIAGAVFHDLTAELRLETGGLIFSAGARRLYGEGEDGRVSAIQADGTFDYSPRHLETHFTLDSFPAGDFLEIAVPLVPKIEFQDQFTPALFALGGDILRHTQITSEIFATTDFEQVLYNAPRLVISYSGDKDLIALFSLSGTDRHFVIDGGQILWDGGSGQITGQSDFSNPDNISFAVNIGYQDLNYALEGTILDRGSLDIRGSYGLNAFVISMGDGTYSGHAGGENVPVPLGGRIARLDFNSSLRYLSPNSWSVELAKLELADIPGFTGNEAAGLLRLTGEANQDQIVLREIYYDDSLGALRGGGTLSITGDENGLRRGNFYAFDEGLEESYTVDVSLAPAAGFNILNLLSSPRDSLGPLGELRLQVSGAGMRLARFNGTMSNTLASGDLNLRWNSPTDFEALLNVSSLVTGRGAREIRASGRVFMDGGEFRGENLRLMMGGLETLAPRLRVSLRDSRVEGSGRVWGKLSERDLDLDFSLGSGFAPIGSWAEYKTALRNFEGALSLTDITIDGQTAGEPFEFTFFREGEGVAFSGGPDNMIFVDIQSGGNFVAAFAEPFPLRGMFRGTLASSSIDAKGEGIYLDLGAIWKFLPFRDGFNIAEGQAIATLQIRGPLGDPEFYGSARGENLRMQVPSALPEDIIPIEMTLVFDGNEMRFTDVPASCGKGAALVSGQFWLEKWVPTTFSLDIVSGNDRPLPFGLDIGGILTRGTVSGTMNISIMDLALNISGDLVAQETEISLDAAEIAASQNTDEWGTVPLIANITITAGKKVEFLWPTRQFPMIQAYADLGAKTRIHANTMNRTFSFTGDVKLRGGEIFYFERSFYIRSGILIFREDQDHFDPRITVRAEVRDRSANGPVTISMVVDNAPLRSFTPRFESSPALSQMEIMSLMGQSLVGSTGEDGSVSNPFLASSADLLAQSQVMRRIQGALRDFLRLDMFSVRTQFFQRAAFGIMGLQSQPVDRIGWVGNYFDNTSVFVGKYIGSNMFAQVMLSLRYDEKKRTFGGYTLEPDFGLELRSPLGNIQWNLVPSHPENWYINDSSFTISWNFAF